jgi:deazaflavin-dependent oxidoreductase (nitroreductase family)
MTQRPTNANGRLQPNRAVAFGRRLFRPMLLRAGIAGVLEVPGRRTGNDVHVTLALWEVDGTLYLMSQYGVTDWVRNLRAAGGGRLRRKGHTQVFTATEVVGDERDRVIAAFRSKADGFLNRDFDRLPSAADHPTFRVEPSG